MSSIKPTPPAKPRNQRNNIAKSTLIARTPPAGQPNLEDFFNRRSKRGNEELEDAAEEAGKAKFAKSVATPVSLPAENTTEMESNNQNEVLAAISELRTSLEAKMEKQNGEMKKQIEEMEKQSASLKALDIKIDDMLSRMEELENKAAAIEKRVAVLEQRKEDRKEIRELKKQILQTKIEARSQNILVYGLQDVPGDPNEDPISKLSKIFTNVYGISNPSFHIQPTRKSKTSHINKKAPLKVCFFIKDQRDAVLFKRAKNSPIRIKSDLPPEVAQMQQTFAALSAWAKNTGRQCKRSDMWIRIDGSNYEFEEAKKYLESLGPEAHFPPTRPHTESSQGNGNRQSQTNSLIQFGSDMES